MVLTSSMWTLPMLLLRLMFVESRKLHLNQTQPMKAKVESTCFSFEKHSGTGNCTHEDYIATTQTSPTCGLSTAIPPEKIGSCFDSQAVLDAHNFARYQHGAPNLIWSKTLTDFAQNIVQSCNFQVTGGQYGENLALRRGLSCLEATQLWIQQERYYPPFGQPGYSDSTSGFTQVVWKDTYQVGCAIHTCYTGNFVACAYWPPGNWYGQYQNEVGRLGEPMLACNAPAPAPVPPTQPPKPQRDDEYIR